MATYLELLALQEDGNLANRVKVAIIVAADVVRLEAAGTTNHALRLAWAKRALEQTDVMAEQMVRAILAQNRAQTPAAITGATDATLQNAVNNAIDLFAQ